MVTELEHPLSEEFRKYLIRLVSDNKELLIIWGTDMAADQEDKLVLSQDEKILAGNNYATLREYLSKKEELLFDKDNFRSWLKQTDVEPYTYYNIDEIKAFIDSGADLFQINKKQCLDILDFIHLVEDYALQVRNKKMLVLREDENIVLFKDYVYTCFFWKAEESDITEIKLKMKSEFKSDVFYSILQNLTDLFKNKLELVS